MNYWLMKSEPETWSWEQQVKAGSKGEAGMASETTKHPTI